MKLRRKLLSAGFALGATALTLTTSTFAWYTSNTEVTATGISGATNAEADSSSLYIAAAKNYDGEAPGAAASDFTAYSTTVAPSAVGTTHVLAPVAFDKATSAATALTYNTMTASGSDVTYTPLTSAAAVYEYVLRFQVPNNGADTAIYISNLSVTNTASASASQQQSLADNSTLGVTAASAAGNVGISEKGFYNVDLLHALKMTTVATPVTWNSTSSKFELSSSSVTTIYDLDGYANSAKDVNITASANAVTYYNTVLGTSISTPTNYLTSSVSGIDAVKCVQSASASDKSDATADASLLCTIPSTTAYIEVRFTFWLDGWDLFCYDTCQKQNFAVELGFSTSNKGIKAATAAVGKA